MNSFDQWQRAWRVVAENRIRAAQAEAGFDNLAGFGRPLEEIIDLNDPYGWIRRTVRDASADTAGEPRNGSQRPATENPNVRTKRQ
jgi:hypothetical protein